MLTAGNTVVLEQKYKKEGSQSEITVKKQRTDNVPFCSKELFSDTKPQSQQITYLGMGVYHQNVIVKNTIGTMASLWARSITIYVIFH